MMAADVYREDDTFFVEIDLPGVTQDNIDIEVDKNTLTVSAERPYEGSENRTSLVKGRAFGSFTRRFVIGEGLDTDSIEAAYENGVLKIAISVLESAQPRKVEVGTIRTAIES
jgi:HSP20 family protein